MGAKRDQAPTWGSAVTRGLLGAALFAVLLVALFGRSVGYAILLSVLMLLLYIPLGHFIDVFFYNRRQAAKRRQREGDARD
jgi:hypothetical protein